MKTKLILNIMAAGLLPVLALAQNPAPPAPPSPAGPPAGDKEKDRKVPVTFLGVETSSIPSVVSEQLGLPKGFGLVVDYVAKDGPAEKGGLQKNDIIRMLNDQIVMEPGQLGKLVRSFQEGTDVTLTILRKGVESKITVKLGKKEVRERRDFGQHHGFKFDFNEGDMEKAFGALDHLKSATPEAVEEIREYAERAREQAREMRDHARELRENAREMGKSFNIVANDDGLTTTRFDLDRAQIVYSDDKGELKIEGTEGRKMLTAKDPQGKVVFSGPVETSEDRDKLPADIRERFEKVTKDIPVAIPPVAPMPPLPLDATTNDTVSVPRARPVRMHRSDIQQVCLERGETGGRLWPAQTVML